MVVSMREKFVRFMQGRYGTDQMNRFLSIVAIILLVLSVFGIPFMYILALALLVWVYFRTFSRNIYKRSAENQKYLTYEWKVKNFWGRKKNEFSQRKVYHIYKCPKCRQKLRVPRGRGKIMITCRKCGTEFMKKS